MTISDQKTNLFFKLSISITVFGALLKYNAWPLILLGSFGMVIFHGIQFFQKKQKSPLDYSRYILIVTFLSNYLFSAFNLPYSTVSSLLTKVALIAFLLLYIKELIPTKQGSTENIQFLSNYSTENLSLLLADLATVYIVLASLFKIFHWEFGIINTNTLLVIGLLSALISIMTNSKEFGK
ncbi:hypothetical protein JQC67_05895 [Aurantibacter crassamenti]|uniref:hypothetical protein n=1 Tax=Aurantibacter crassamenti TaxID=1837375 RepID=UPI001939951B|nr:hypothetical protein [Aurantibacter crassamenti]MBM1105670.1 hypothetical protein [Aurantibacter crassamenti]